MWNLKKKKQNKLIDTEKRLVVARGRGWRVGEWVKEVKRYKLPGIK